MKKRGRPPKAPPLGLNGLSDDDQKKLASFVHRLERLHEERAEAVAPFDADIRAVLFEARALNFDGATIKALVRERCSDQTKRAHKEALRDSYRHALGMLADTPLGRSALERDGTRPPRKPRKAKSSAGNALDALQDNTDTLKAMNDAAWSGEPAALEAAIEASDAGDGAAPAAIAPQSDGEAINEALLQSSLDSMAQLRAMTSAGDKPAAPDAAQADAPVTP